MTLSTRTTRPSLTTSRTLWKAWSRTRIFS